MCPPKAAYGPPKAPNPAPNEQFHAPIAACSRWPSIPELEIARELRRAAPLARPNGRMIGLADELMGRQGRMSEAMSETGRGLPWIEVDEGDPFEFGAQFDLIT